MTRLDEMLQANEAYCKNPPVDYTDEDVHESKLRENPLLPKEESSPQTEARTVILWRKILF